MIKKMMDERMAEIIAAYSPPNPEKMSGSPEDLTKITTIIREAMQEMKKDTAEAEQVFQEYYGTGKKEAEPAADEVVPAAE